MIEAARFNVLFKAIIFLGWSSIGALGLDEVVFKRRHMREVDMNRIKGQEGVRSRPLSGAAGMMRLGCWGAMALAILVSLVACAGTPSSGADDGLASAGAGSGPRIELVLKPGPSYSAKMGFGPFAYTVRPQVAAWIESPDGLFLGTIYLTEKSAKGSWLSAPAEGRPEALPIWEHRAGLAAGKNKNPADGKTTTQAEGPDAVTAATAKAGARVGSSIAGHLAAGTYVVCLEVNRSYDWNATYTKANSGVNGQPSLLYRAELSIGGPERADAIFTPVGTGSVDGSSGLVRSGLDGIDSAIGLFSCLTVSYLPE
jgi:hypothetical protein